MKVVILAKKTTPDQNGILIYQEMKRQGREVLLGSYYDKFSHIKKMAEGYDWVFLTGMARLKPGQLRELTKTHKLLLWSADGNNILTNHRDNLWEERKGIADIIISSTMSNTNNFQGYAKKVVFMPQYHDDHFYPIFDRLNKSERIYDICFLGASLSEYESRGEYLKCLRDRYKCVFRGTINPLNINHLCQGKDASKFYAQSKIAIGLPHYFPETREYTTSDRIYKAMGCGCFYLMYEMPGLECLFKAGVHLDVYKPGVENLIEKIDYYLKDELLRESIASAGQAEIQKKHTLKVRAKEYWELMEGFDG